MTKVNKLDSTYMLPSGLWCTSRARAICRPRSRTCSKLPRVFFFIFPSTHATTVTVFSVFDTVPRSLLRGPLGEALVDMREKIEETKSGRKLWTRGPPRRTFWCVHCYIFLIVFLMTKFAPFPTKILVQKIPRARANAKAAAFSSVVRARRL